MNTNEWKCLATSSPGFIHSDPRHSAILSVLYNIRAVFVSHSTDGDEDPYLFIQLFSVQVEDYIEKKQKSSKSVYLCARYSNAMKQKIDCSYLV